MSYAQALAIGMLPENVLLAGIVLLLVVDIAAGRARSAIALATATVAVAALAAAYLHMTAFAAVPFPGQYSMDGATSLAKAVVLAFSVPVLLMSRDDFEGNTRFAVLVLSSLYGFCLLVSSDSFLTLFLGLEIMSLPVYVLVLLAFKRPDSAEAALKYLVLGGAATATFLMGVSLLFGSTGSMALGSFGVALGSEGTLARAAVVLIVVAFFLKAAVVPFHAWAPDAYEAATIPVTAYMATVIKAGALLAAVRLFGSGKVSGALVGMIAFLPLVSIVWGNIAAMRQASFRRMIAYSSIAHAGYLFYAFLGAGPGRFQAVAFYVIAYGLMNLLAFASIPRGEDDAARDRLENLKGLFHRQPFSAVMIGIAMLSLAGIPPFPGFIAKFLIFKNVIAAGYTGWAVMGFVGSFLGIYFYLRVIQFMFMGAKEGVAAPAGRAPALAAVLCLVPALLISVFPGWFLGRM
jgi:NADH-quinone oxidoreductase subunit N